MTRPVETRLRPLRQRQSDSGMDNISLTLLAFSAAQIFVMLRVMLRPGRDPAARVAWVAVIAVLPVIGLIGYLMFGEVRFGRRRLSRVLKARSLLPCAQELRPANSERPRSGSHYEQLFRVGETIGGYPPVGGNRAQLVTDSEEFVNQLVADIEAATDHVHLEFYIWLPDRSGVRVAEALTRAAGRGVTCRALADGMGSRSLIRSRHWRAMKGAGVRLAVALPLGIPLLGPLRGRIDLRNHRKLVVIDGEIAWCGSQNCADAEFLVKRRYAPWVDVMVRCTGPVVWQSQHLFAGDWMSAGDESLVELLRQPAEPGDGGLIGQVIGSGPADQHSGVPQLFATLLYNARSTVMITTPYYVPNETIQSALCACARRGVMTTIIFPRRNDSRIVAAASRSFYPELLDSGVRIHEFEGGLLHAKTFTMDNEISLIGSANMDRRSFELNFENNLLLQDPAFTAALRRQQFEYLRQSVRVEEQQVRAWGMSRHLWHNSMAVLGPLL